MNLRKFVLFSLSMLFLLPYAAPQTTKASLAASAPTPVPPLIPYSGMAEGPSDHATATFLIYRDETGGEALWAETQTVILDLAGHYQIQLGATNPNGLPAQLFATGEARWLEVQIAGQRSQPRVLLASVPYALKAADAETLGGLPASAFALAGSASKGGRNSTGSIFPDATLTVTTTGGAAGYVPEFSGASSILISPLFINGTRVGVGTKTPAQALDVTGGVAISNGLTVSGTSTYNGQLLLAASGTATAAKGFNSQALRLFTSAYNSATKAVVPPRFQWQAEPTGNNTASPGATLNLISSMTTATPTETGFYFNPNGTVHFAPGQTFPGGTGTGTITGVTAGTALTGGGTSGNVTLNVDTTKVPLLAANNTFNGNQTINGNLSASGTVSGGTVNAATGFYLGGSEFAFSPGNTFSVYVGFAGNPGDRGTSNTGDGILALSSNAGGSSNTASGALALRSNTTGSSNTASGAQALASNTTGNDNTAYGAEVLQGSSGSFNTGVGYEALMFNNSGMDNTAVGIVALVNNVSGNYNTAVGSEALFNDRNGADNTAIGTQALLSNTTGNGNIGMGYFSGGTADSSAGTGSYNTALGYLAAFGTGSISNATAIGANAEVTQSNTMVLGCIAGLNSCPASVSVGIGTTTPDSLLTVNGNADKPGGGSWGTYSDGRLKTINGSFGSGLGQVMQLRPIRYRYRPDNGMGIRDMDEHVGVVAQEVQRVIPEAVTENGKGYLLVNNDPIIWSMVNAIKEQQREIEQQKKLLRAQGAAMRNLEAEVREARKTLHKVETQAAGTQSAMVASK